MLNPNLNYPGNGFKIKQLLGTLALAVALALRPACPAGAEQQLAGSSIPCALLPTSWQELCFVEPAAHAAHARLGHMNNRLGHPNRIRYLWGQGRVPGAASAPCLLLLDLHSQALQIALFAYVICAVCLCWNFCWFCSVRKRLATSKIGSFNRFHFLLKNATPREQISLSRGSGKFRHKILYLLN